MGMDMCRKYLQMGMTRAKRYANYSGGRKYVKVKGEVEEGDVEGPGMRVGKVQREKSEGHKDQRKKEEASQIFRGVWENAKRHEGYVEKKRVFMKKQKAWDRAQKASDAGRKVKTKTEAETEIEAG